MCRIEASCGGPLFSSANTNEGPIKFSASASARELPLVTHSPAPEISDFREPGHWYHVLYSTQYRVPPQRQISYDGSACLPRDSEAERAGPLHAEQIVEYLLSKVVGSPQLDSHATY